MNMRRWCTVLLAACLAAAGLWSCRKAGQETLTSEETTLETAGQVTHVTSGLIARAEGIRVRFVRPMAAASAVGRAVDRRVFAFTPPLKGTAVWEDPQTLRFHPSADLPLDTEFAGVLLLDRITDEPADPLPFRFRTGPREVTFFEGQFLSLDERDPGPLAYRARLELSEPTSLRDVERAFSFFLTEEEGRKSRRLDAAWEKFPAQGAFLCTVSGIRRSDRRQYLTATAKSAPLGLRAPFERRIVLESLSGFSITEVAAYSEGRTPEIAVRFSEDLDPDQDLEGLLRIEPYAEVRLDAAANTVFVTGDLAYGTTYRLVANGGIRSRRGTETEGEQEFVLEEDIPPQMSFLEGGVFLTSSGDRRIFFKTVNLRQVQVEVKRVFENNLGQFLQTERLASSADRNEPFNNEYVYRVGVTAAREKLTIGEQHNVWLNHELDLRSLVGPADQGLYLVSLSFDQEDMIWQFDEEERYYWGDDYYSDPNSYGYIWAHGRIYKPVIASDIGLTWKAGANQHVVFATDLIDAEPEWGVDVALMSYQNQLIARGKTDWSGKVIFPDVRENVFYVTGTKAGQRSVIKSNEMGWDLSSFDTQGEDVPPQGTRAFIYTERGVYRPGDRIHLAAIVRNSDGTFPDNHPVTLKLTNPLDQLVHEEINAEGLEGFYYFDLETASEDPTGNWKVELAAGGRSFAHTIRVETIVPFRLKVEISTDQEKILHDDFTFAGELASTYLFGAPASGLEAAVEASLEPRERRFGGYPGYFFSNESREYEPYAEVIFSDYLDGAGRAPLYWVLPRFYGTPSALNLVLTARVFEKGGRASRKTLTVPVEVYPTYVGLKRPELRWGYAQVGQRLSVPVIAVNATGTAQAGRRLSYRVYRNTTYWWWEYDSHADYRLRYKSDVETELIDEGTLLSGAAPASVQVTPDGWGEYLIEVEDEAGHAAGFFFRASAWAGQSAAGEQGGILAMAADREIYHPGEEAIVTFPSTDQGRLLVTVEKAHDILSAAWYPLQDGETKVRIPITEEMVPNAYVTLSLIQPHAQTANDRPIRMFGVVPLMVEEEQTHERFSLTVPEEIAPNESFRVTLQTRDRKPTRFTLAVVDEGLLDITGFSTPDPWEAFYRKQRLGVASYDLFAHVIGVQKGDIFRTFAVGGGDEALMAESAEMGEKKRFPAVVLYQGPTRTDTRGRAVVDFTMPNYMGSVRIMAVAASGESYGSASETVPVRSDLVLLPTLPRVLGPAEEIEVPVTVFALRENIGSVSVSVETEGPVAVEGSSRKSLSFREIEEREASFSLRSAAEVGDATVTITAAAANVRSESVTHLRVRPSSPPLYRIERKTAEPGSRLLLRIPDEGMPGTNTARLSVLRQGDLDLNRRLRWLIRYPYGCIEQTVSSVFPQLYLGRVMEMDRKDELRTDANINAAIEKLRTFQLASGAFSFWPGSSSVSLWGTSYAGHFLLEARELGYAVPGDMVERWLLFQSGRALSTADDLTTRIYRVYLLSVAGKPAFGPMNLIRENHLYEMTDHQKWLLAAAYELAGAEDTADRIVLGAGTSVEPYSEFAGTYGSGLRDRAMILDAAVHLSLWDTADEIYEEIAGRLGSEDWYSTQTLGYCLLAVGKYLTGQQGEEPPLMKGKLILPDGSVLPFSTREFSFRREIDSGFGQYIIVSVDPETTLPRIYVTLEWEGVPLVAGREEAAENISLDVVWYDEDGRPISPDSLLQGSTFWGRYQVRKRLPYHLTLEEMALTQIVASGWEIENLRLTGEEPPRWMQDFELGNVEYTDIRDDRISWFFDMPSHVDTLDFVVKLQAVTKGRFNLPPASCEAMYRHDFRAVVPGREVRVEEGR